MQNNLPREGVRLSKKQALNKILSLQFFVERNIIYPPHIREPFKYYVAEFLPMGRVWYPPNPQLLFIQKIPSNVAEVGEVKTQPRFGNIFWQKKICNIVFEGLPWSIMF